MKIYRCKIEGKTALMQHKMPEDVLFSLLGTKSSRKKDKEPHTPRQIAERHVYQNPKLEFYVPTDHIMGAISHVSGDYKQKNSIRKSLKSLIAGVVRPVADQAILETRKGKAIKDFEIDIRKGNNHQKGAVAVCRPRFDDWATEFQLEIDDNLVHPDTVCEILNDAGKRSGIGSFRVQKGGYFGQFIVTEWNEVKK